MTIIQAVILGIVQGLTEFLPISSSGHLALFQEFLNLGTTPLLFDIVVHVGTLTAVFIYFRRDLLHFFKHHLHLLIIGTLPAVTVGFYVYKNFQFIFSDLYVVALSFLGTASLLFLSTLIKRSGNPLEQTSPLQAFLIGIFQAAAILPGLSRSGSTIVGGRFVGLNKKAAFSFAFILSAPAILGALVLSLSDLDKVSPDLIAPSLIGFVAALFSGLLGLRLLDYLFKRENLLPFAFYTLILGSALLGIVSS